VYFILPFSPLDGLFHVVQSVNFQAVSMKTAAISHNFALKFVAVVHGLDG